MSTAKQKTKKITLNSVDSDEDSEHELFYYANDRIRLMKEVLKLIKPKKIKSIAPDFMKNLDIDETNSILLEELLGISNKRLKHILHGDNVDTVSTSSDSEVEHEKPIDIISLDDISDTDDEFGLASVNNSHDMYEKNKSKDTTIKKFKEIKKEKGEHSKKKGTQSKDKHGNESENDKLMNVLEILELQARARAIRSQLALENINKNTVSTEKAQIVEEDDDTAVIVSSPKNEEIVITSSDSEDDSRNKKKERTSKETCNKSFNEISEAKFINNKNKNLDNNKENLTISKTIGDINISSNDKQNEESGNNDLSIESIQDDVSSNIKNNDSNISFDISRDCVNEENNQASYKSDSDNDIINLDSEDIEIK